MARSVTRGDLVAVTAVRGEQLDHLALDQRRVDVHHDQPHRAAQQAGRLDRDVHALRGRLEREQGAEPFGVRAGHVQVDGGDGVARHPLDPVDVGAAVGDPARDGGHGGRLERRPDHGDVGATLTTDLVVAGAAVDVDAHPEAVGGRLHGVAQPLPVAGRRHQDAQDQPAAEHDLLDVEDLDPGLGQGGEDRGGDAGPVLAGDGEEQGLRLWSLMGSRLSAPGDVGGGPYVSRMSRDTTPRLRRAAAPDLCRQGLRDAFGWTFTDYGPDYTGIHRPAEGEMGGLNPRPPARAAAGDPLQRRPRRHARAVGRRRESPRAVRLPGRRFHFTDPFGNELAVWTGLTSRAGSVAIRWRRPARGGPGHCETGRSRVVSRCSQDLLQQVRRLQRPGAPLGVLVVGAVHLPAGDRGQHHRRRPGHHGTPRAPA